MEKKLPILFTLLIVVKTIFSQNIAAYDWANLIGTGGGNDLTWDLTTDAAGNVYVTGKFAGDSIDFDPGIGESIGVSAGADDIFLCKYTSGGQLVWAKAIGGTGYDESHSVVLDEDDNVWITGTFTATADFNPGTGVNNLTSLGLRDIFLAKYDNNGNYLWAGAMGGTSDDVANKIARHPITGDIWICGGFESTADFDPSANDFPLTSNGGKDIFYARYNTSGVLIGARRLQGNSNDLATGIAFDKDGNMLLSGIFVGTINFNPTGTAFNLASNSGSNDGFLAKYDLTATLIWAKALGGKTQNDYAINVKTDTSGNIVVCGYFADTCSFQQGVGIAQKVALGVTSGYAAIYTPSGNYKGLVTFGAANEYFVARDIALDKEGYLYITGYASTDFDAGNDIGTSYIISVTGKNAYLLKYDLTGNFILGHNITYGASNATGYCAHVDAMGRILVGGEMQGTGDFDPSALTKNKTSFTAATDAFFASYFNCSIPGVVTYSSDTVCRGSNAVLNASANFGYYVAWYADANATTLLAEYQYTTPQLQSSTVYYLVDSICGIKNVRPVTVLVNQLPNNSVTQAGNTLTSAATNVNYAWFDCNTELPVSGATLVNFTPANAGNYGLKVTDTQTGCVNYSTCFVVNPTAIPNVLSSNIKFYPNPANNVISIEVPVDNNDNTGEINVQSITGQLLIKQPFSINPINNIDISVLPKGYYTITIKKQSETASFQFLKSL